MGLDVREQSHDLLLDGLGNDPAALRANCRSTIYAAKGGRVGILGNLV